MIDRTSSLADQLEDLLPQTQCTQCGYHGCRPYAQAMARGEALPNRCPPGGAEGIRRLSGALNRAGPLLTLDPAHGVERTRTVAVIDPARCIGCTLCIQACPVDAIVGAPKAMHVVLSDWCTGCDLCIAPCPIDCIDRAPVSGAQTGWAAWSPAQADTARDRHTFRAQRLTREQAEDAARLAAAALPDATVAPAAASAKQAIIQAAIERARQKQLETRAQKPRPTPDQR